MVSVPVHHAETVAVGEDRGFVDGAALSFENFGCRVLTFVDVLFGRACSDHAEVLLEEVEADVCEDDLLVFLGILLQERLQGCCLDAGGRAPEAVGDSSSC